MEYRERKPLAFGMIAIQRRGRALLLLLVGSLLSSSVTGWEPYTPFSPFVYIHNRTIYWGCDAKSNTSQRVPLPSHGFTTVSCNDRSAPLSNCDHQLTSPEVFLFMHSFLGNSNYFHFWTTDYLPLLSLIMGPHAFALPMHDWEAEKVNETFMERLERPYHLLAFAPISDPRHPNMHFFCEHEHINFLLRIFDDNPILIEDDQIYCSTPATHVWPLVSGKATEGLHEGSPTKYAGLVWQTQLYVRQRIFGLSERCPECSTRTKPVLVWVERTKFLRGDHLVAPERYLDSWEEILDQLRDDFDVRLLNAGKLKPQELVDLMDHADILLGVHGAGLQNMVWMRPYHGVVEIRWPQEKKRNHNFKKMSTHLCHFWYEVECYHLNATEFMARSMPLVDQHRIVNAVKQAWEEVQSFHSEPPSAGISVDRESKDEL